MNEQQAKVYFGWAPDSDTTPKARKHTAASSATKPAVADRVEFRVGADPDVVEAALSVLHGKLLASMQYLGTTIPINSTDTLTISSAPTTVHAPVAYNDPPKRSERECPQVSGDPRA